MRSRGVWEFDSSLREGVGDDPERLHAGDDCRIVCDSGRSSSDRVLDVLVGESVRLLATVLVAARAFGQDDDAELLRHFPRVKRHQRSIRSAGSEDQEDLARLARRV